MIFSDPTKGSSLLILPRFTMGSSLVIYLLIEFMIFSDPTEGSSLLILPRFARAGGSFIHDLFWSYQRIIIADPTKICQGFSLVISLLLEVLSFMIFSDPTEGSSLLILPRFDRAGGSIIHDLFWSYQRIIIVDLTKICHESSLVISLWLEVLSSMIFSGTIEVQYQHTWAYSEESKRVFFW